MRRVSRSVSSSLSKLSTASSAVISPRSSWRNDGIDDLQRPWHAQADQIAFDTLDDGGDKFGVRSHHALPFTAITRPTAS
jgi:hypothetical protein